MTEETQPTSEQINFEEALGGLLKSSVSGTGEEELLRIASRYSLQITARQIKTLLWLYYFAQDCEQKGYSRAGQFLQFFCQRWLELKENNNSDLFVMKALEFISLRRFLGEGSFKVNIDK